MASLKFGKVLNLAFGKNESEWSFEILPPVEFFKIDNNGHLVNYLNKSYFSPWTFQVKGIAFLKEYGALVSTLDLSTFTITEDEIGILLPNTKRLKSLVLPFAGLSDFKKIELPATLEHLTIYNSRITESFLNKIANIESLKEIIFWGCCVDVSVKKYLDDHLLTNDENNSIALVNTSKDFNQKFNNTYKFEKLSMISCSEYFLKCITLADYPNLKTLQFNAISVFPILSNSFNNGDAIVFPKLQCIRMYANSNPHQKSSPVIDEEIKFYKEIFELTFGNYTENILNIELVFTDLNAKAPR